MVNGQRKYTDRHSLQNTSKIRKPFENTWLVSKLLANIFRINSKHQALLSPFYKNRDYIPFFCLFQHRCSHGVISRTKQLPIYSQIELTNRTTDKSLTKKKSNEIIYIYTQKCKPSSFAISSGSFPSLFLTLQLACSPTINRIQIPRWPNLIQSKIISFIRNATYHHEKTQQEKPNSKNMSFY